MVPLGRRTRSLRPRRNVSPTSQALFLALGLLLAGLGLWGKPGHPIGIVALALCWLPLVAGILGWAPWLELARLRRSRSRKCSATIPRGP